MNTMNKTLTGLVENPPNYNTMIKSLINMAMVI